MAAIDDAIEAVGALLERLDEARSAAQHAVGQADEALDAATAYGNQEGMAGCAQVKEELESAGQQVNGVYDAVEQAQATLQGLRDA